MVVVPLKTSISLEEETVDPRDPASSDSLTRNLSLRLLLRTEVNSVAEPSSLKRLSQEKKETLVNNKVPDHPAASSSETCPTLLLKTTLENSSKVLVKSRPSDLLLTVMVAQRVSLTLISKLKNKPKRPSKNPELNSMEEPSELTSLMPVVPDPAAEAEVVSEEEVDSVEEEVASVAAEAVTQVASVKVASVKEDTVKVATVKVDTVKVETVKVDTVRVETVKVDTVKVETVKVDSEKVVTVKVDSALKVDSEEEAVEVPAEAVLPPEEADKDPETCLNKARLKE